MRDRTDGFGIGSGNTSVFDRSPGQLYPHDPSHRSLPNLTSVATSSMAR